MDMEIFSEIKSKVTETAKSAIKKSNEIVEITKLNIAIGDAQNDINKVLKDIGKIIYDAYKDGDLFNEEIADKCTKIDSKAEEISEMRQKLSELKKVQVCPECGKENEYDAFYCSYCGHKMAKEQTVENEEE